MKYGTSSMEVRVRLLNDQGKEKRKKVDEFLSFYIPHSLFFRLKNSILPQKEVSRGLKA
jgi:hypothetical protein